MARVRSPPVDRDEPRDRHRLAQDRDPEDRLLGHEARRFREGRGDGPDVERRQVIREKDPRRGPAARARAPCRRGPRPSPPAGCATTACPSREDELAAAGDQAGDDRRQTENRGRDDEGDEREASAQHGTREYTVLRNALRRAEVDNRPGLPRRRAVSPVGDRL